MKTIHTQTGTSNEVKTFGGVVAYASFSQGASGSAQLEVQMDGDWIPAEVAVTATMSAAIRAGEPPSNQKRSSRYRWKTTITSGTITTYIAAD